MNSDQTDTDAFEAGLRLVAEVIAPELKRGGDHVEIDSILRAITPDDIKALKPTSLADTKEQIKVINSALKTLRGVKAKLEGVGIKANWVSVVEDDYQYLIGLLQIATGREKLTTKGGVKWPAREVGKMVARAFVYHGVKVTFGVRPDGAGPSTAFGRAVEGALKELGIDAGWRRPAEHARDYAMELAAEIELANREGTYR